MEKLKNITIIFLLVVGLLSSVAPAKTTSVLLQEGLYAEEITGDLDAAIKIYEQVISESKKVKRDAAQATYRIGMCFLKKGNKAKAAEYFQQIVSNYQSAKGLVEKATQQLKKILPQHEEHLPWEAMVYIYDKHMEAHKKAKSKGIAVNSHIVGVDEDFIKYSGGILTHETSKKVSAGKEIWLGNFSRAGDVDFFNEQLEPQQIRFSKRETDAIGKYMLLWKADRDMEAGEVRVIAYRSRKTSKLIATDNGYQMQFNNHYGSPVLENFFLVVPLDVSIVEQSREYTTRKKFDMCEIYHWQREVPANTTNKVDVLLAKSEMLIQKEIEALIKKMHQPEARRFTALNKLIEIGEPAVEPLISELEKSNNWQVPKALGAIGDKRAVEPLIQKWQKCDWSPMKEVISEALERITGKKLGQDKKKWDKWRQETQRFISPEDTLRNFMAAAMKLDMNNAMEYVAGDSHDYKDIQEIFEESEHPFNVLFRKTDPAVPVKIIETKIIDNMCEAVWQITFKEDFTIKGKTIKAGETFNIDGNLRRYGDKWLITGI